MWSQFFVHLEQSFFGLLIWMSLTHMFSECHTYNSDYDEDVTSRTGRRLTGSFSSALFDDGVDDVVDLLYNDNVGKRIFESGSGAVDRLSPEEAWELKEKLKGLYALLKNNPALMDRRLQVGSRKPHVNITQQLLEKRSYNPLTAVPVCPAKTEWRLLQVARDINDSVVEVFQPSDGSDGHQWFYTTVCDDGHRDLVGSDCPRCCRGINRGRYHSHCMTRKSFVMALVRKPSESHYDWNWIQVDSSCSCSISPF